MTASEAGIWCSEFSFLRASHPNSIRAFVVLLAHNLVVFRGRGPSLPFLQASSFLNGTLLFFTSIDGKFSFGWPLAFGNKATKSWAFGLHVWNVLLLSLVFIYDEILSRSVCMFGCRGQFCWGAEKHRALVLVAHFFVAVFTNPSMLHEHGGCFFFNLVFPSPGFVSPSLCNCAFHAVGAILMNC